MKNWPMILTTLEVWVAVDPEASRASLDSDRGLVDLVRALEALPI